MTGGNSIPGGIYCHTTVGSAMCVVVTVCQYYYTVYTILYGGVGVCVESLKILVKQRAFLVVT